MVRKKLVKGYNVLCGSHNCFIEAKGPREAVEKLLTMKNKYGQPFFEAGMVLIGCIEQNKIWESPEKITYYLAEARTVRCKVIPFLTRIKLLKGKGKRLKLNI